MSDQIETTVSAEPVAVVVAPAAPAAPTAPAAPAAQLGRIKFASESPKKANPWGIKNDDGLVVTSQYLRQYLQCWTRQEWGFVDQPTMTRKQIYDACMSDAWMTARLAEEPNATASRLGQLCSFDPMWGKAAENARANGNKRKAKTAAAVPATPAPTAPAPTAETIVPETPDAAATEFAAAAAPVTNTDVTVSSEDAKAAARKAAAERNRKSR